MTEAKNTRKTAQIEFGFTADRAAVLCAFLSILRKKRTSGSLIHNFFTEKTYGMHEF